MLATWEAFEGAVPDLAEAGARLFNEHKIAYLATVRRDGSPRVHPVCPVLFDGALYVFISPTSPKSHDLRRGGRYALHALPGKDDEEFLVTGRVRLVEDPARHSAVYQTITFQTDEHDPLFELGIDKCLWGVWENVGQPGTRPIRKRWEVGG